jgi:hypothetical protein
MFICLLLVLNFLASEIYTKSICASMKKGLVAIFIVAPMAHCIIGIKVGCPWRCMIIAGSLGSAGWMQPLPRKWSSTMAACKCGECLKTMVRDGEGRTGNGKILV